MNLPDQPQQQQHQQPSVRGAARAPLLPGDLHLIQDDGTDDPSEEQQAVAENQDCHDWQSETPTAFGADDNSINALESSLFQSLDAFQDAASLATEITEQVIQQQAAQVNKRLLNVQDRLQRHKRRRLSTASPVQDGSSKAVTAAAAQDPAVSEKESLSIYKQAARTKRMSDLLRNLETTQYLLMQEISSSLDDAIEA